MQPRILLAIAAAAALVAACGRNEPKSAAQPSSTGGASQVQSAGSGAAGNGTGVQSSAAAAAAGQATGEGAEPHQQQVDPKEPAQRRDFQQQGDQAGPKSPETSPKPESR